MSENLVAKSFLQDPYVVHLFDNNKIFLLKEDDCFTYAFEYSDGEYSPVDKNRLVMGREVVLGDELSAFGIPIKLNEEYYV